jgi:DNA/RNA endonuclease YhcR with UshA esterase domain
MEKEEKIVVVLLMMAVASLSVAYVTFLPSEDTRGHQLTAMSAIGDEVFFEGTVIGKHLTFTGNHLLLDIDYDSQVITVFVPDNAGSVDVNKAVSENDRVRIVGIVDEYKGDREVVVNKKNDVTVL